MSSKQPVTKLNPDLSHAESNQAQRPARVGYAHSGAMITHGSSANNLCGAT
jgi:hypothetical protein